MFYNFKVLLTTPHIYADKKEEPNYIDKMPVPSGCLKPKMLSASKMTQITSNKTYCKKDGSDYNMKTMKTRSHKENRRINTISKSKWCMHIFQPLKKSKKHP